MSAMSAMSYAAQAVVPVREMGIPDLRFQEILDFEVAMRQRERDFRGRNRRLGLEISQLCRLSVFHTEYTPEAILIKVWVWAKVMVACPQTVEERRAIVTEQMLMRRSLRVFLLVVVMEISAGLSVCLPGAQGAVTPPAVRQPRVLVLYSNERLLPANVAVDEAIRTTFHSAFEKPVEFYAEFLDVNRFPSLIQQERTREFLSEKYRERPPDVIIAAGGSALHFLIKHRATLFPRVPVVHCGVSPNGISASMPDDLIVGIPHAVDMVATLELALRLQPDTRQVAVVGGGDASRVALSNLAAKVEFLWLTNQSVPELEDEVSHLPDHTVLFYGTMFGDTAGNAFTPRAALDQIAPASRVPIYGYYDTYLGHGIVGGSVLTFPTIGRTAAQIAIRILKGQHPQDAVRGVTDTPTPMFDWRELRRWKISENRLPPGSEILFREPTLWEQHRWAITGILLITLVETALILLLAFNLIRRRHAERLLRESENRLRLAAEAAGAGFWSLDLKSDVFWLTDQARELLAIPERETVTLERFLAVVHPEDQEPLRGRLKDLSKSRGSTSFKFRILRPDGATAWISSRSSVQYDPTGKPLSLTGLSTDVTEQHRNAEEMQRLQVEAWHADRVARTGAITSSLAHELNQPLAATLSASQAGLRFMAAEHFDPVDIRDILESIVHDTKRAGAVVSGMRALLRRQPSRRERINIADAVGETLKLLHGELLTNHVDVRVRCQPDCYAVADKTQIQQVILNLVTNSVQAMRSSETDTRRLEVVSGCEGTDTVQVSVSDSGPGVPPEKVTKLFEAFWTTKPQGLGIGLAICRSILESHRGRIWVANTQPGKTTFCFTLPLDVPL
jgi:PAS domain S-box-containing protein